MSFPNISTTDAPDNYNCSGNVKFQLYSSPVIPVITSYNSVPGYPKVSAPVVNPASYTPIKYGTGGSAVTMTYQSTYGASDMDTNGFYTNWYSSSDTSGLNSSSTLVKAIGRTADGVSPCLQEPDTSNTSGTSGITSFAGALYAAETVVLAEQGAYPVVNNLPTRTAIVFLSDGQANALADYFPAAGTAVTSNGVRDSNGKSIMNSSGLYPSGIDACQQAIMASQYAASLGTRVYSIAYGSETGGCLYNSSGSGTVNSTILAGKTTGSGSGSDVAITNSNPLILTAGTTNPVIDSMTDITPCNTIMNMASDLWYFYSDASQEKSGGSGVNKINLNCKSTDHPALTSMNDIFQDIYGSLTAARLIPNSSI
jgi:hypothetical protein